MKLLVADHFDTEPKTMKDAVSGTVAAGLIIHSVVGMQAGVRMEMRGEV